MDYGRFRGIFDMFLYCVALSRLLFIPTESVPDFWSERVKKRASPRFPCARRLGE